MIWFIMVILLSCQVGPTVNNVMVFSDDPSWVEEQIISMKETHPMFNIYTLKPPRHFFNGFNETEKKKGTIIKFVTLIINELQMAIDGILLIALNSIRSMSEYMMSNLYEIIYSMYLMNV